MPTMDEMRLGGTPFDPFLYATVGEDRNGNTVTVLSTLARLGLEPWDAAAELAKLTRTEAGARLGGLLTRFRDVPALALASNHVATTLRLIDLLPPTSGRPFGQTVQGASPSGTRGIGVLPALLLLILFIAQMFFLGSDGSGN